MAPYLSVEKQVKEDEKIEINYSYRSSKGGGE
jgi:hypothetical protein